MLSRRHAHVSRPSLYSTIWAPPHERVHSGLVPGPRPLTVLIRGSHRVPPLVPTRRKVLSMSKTFAGSRRPLTGHQRVHRSLNAPPCALTVFHRPHEIYHTVAHGRLSRHHVTATLCYVLCLYVRISSYRCMLVITLLLHMLYVICYCYFTMLMVRYYRYYTIVTYDICGMASVAR